jgi:RNA polymerase sigma-70 factor (ECF subfamily)
MDSSGSELEQLLSAARDGSREAIGDILGGCRDYLLQIAIEELTSDLSRKLGPSDLVQDTLLEAQRDFGRFRGRTRGEVLAWLRGILLHNLANATRHYLATGMRQVSRESGLSVAIEAGLPAPGSDEPVTRILALERHEALAAALTRLPPEAQAVVRARNLEGLSFADIGARLGLSGDAARKVWARAVLRLQREFAEDLP